MKVGHHTYSEIITQTAAWRDALALFHSAQAHIKQSWANVAPSNVAFIGCGSTYYLSQIAAALFQALTGLPARALPSSELLLFGADALPGAPQTLLVTISRSGTTTETVAAAERFRQLGGLGMWTICCDGSSPLVHVADVALLAESAQEESMAQTRSFSSMLLLAQALAAAISGQDTHMLDQLPARGEQILQQNGDLMETLGGQTPWTHAFYMGSGLHYGLACEVMLKMQEMALTYSQGYHFLEFRHGPKSMVDEQTLLVGLLSDAARRHEIPVLQEMAALGGRVLAVNEPATSSLMESIHFGDTLPWWASPVLYLPALQLLAYHRAISKGLNPDAPRNLQAVIHLNAADFTT